ncbi:hypothetical protein [Nocardioides sp. L-11A]|uniref:hypothetical protein n=1 Tax=Nocardioides sp. L-11A TaxID=3043848 RepID=UPI00249B9D6F|nr:hypothetical protein QJ852_21365 [Nocardioides sp. L-11A]
MAETDTEEAKSRIDWPATFAGAGAAVTVAVLLSTLGAAGTLIGAALGSIIATVSSALYKQGIESSRRRMAEVQAAALQRVTLADQNVRRAARRSDPEAAERELDRAHRHLDAAGEELADEPAPQAVPAERSRWAELQWKRIAVLAATVFVLSLLVISAVELLAGKSVSTITGGTDGSDRTSLTGVFGNGGKGKGERRPEPPAEETPTPTPTPVPTPTPTETPTGPVPTEPTDPVTPSDTPTPTPTPSGTPAPSPTPTPTPSPSQGVSP